MIYPAVNILRIPKNPPAKCGWFMKADGEFIVELSSLSDNWSAGEIAFTVCKMSIISFSPVRRLFVSFISRLLPIMECCKMTSFLEADRLLNQVTFVCIGIFITELCENELRIQSSFRKKSRSRKKCKKFNYKKKWCDPRKSRDGAPHRPPYK